jgi:hypothetical protein
MVTWSHCIAVFAVVACGMWSKPLAAIGMAITALLLSGCSSLLGKTCDNMHFTTIDVENVSSIRLYKNSSRETIENEISRQTDADKIQKIFEFFESRKNKWRANPLGVPVGGYRVVFWSNDERLGAVSFGEEFFVGQGCGYFFASSASVDEVREFVRMLGVEESDELEF